MSFIQFLSYFLVVSQLVAAQDQNVQFGQVANINGDMQLNRIILPDNSKIEAFSQTQQQVIVNQNPNPLSANHIVGSTGNSFVQLSPNSLTIDTNDATDLVGAQIELPIDQATLDQNQVIAANTFVAVLSDDRQAWIIMEGLRSVNTTDSTVRIVKMSNIDGEYMAVGRQTVETANALTPFGSPQAQPPVPITGSGIQEVEFTDGFRMSIDASQPMTLNVEVVNGISSSMITDDSMTTNDFRYLVTTNLAAVLDNLNDMMAVVQLPLNAERTMQAALAMGAGPNDAITLGLSQRKVIKNPGGATAQPQRRRFFRRQDNTTATDTGVADAMNTTTIADAPPTDTATTTTAADAAVTDQQPPADQQQATQTQLANPAATQLLLEPTFSPITSETGLDRTNMRVAAIVNQLDGEFILTLKLAGAGGGVAAQPPPPESTAGGEIAGTTTEIVTATAAAAAAAVPPPLKKKNKRQETLTPTSGGVVVTMAELQNMIDMQKTGNVFPIWSMMERAKGQQQQQQLNANIPPPPPPVMVKSKKRDGLVRAMPLRV